MTNNNQPQPHRTDLLVIVLLLILVAAVCVIAYQQYQIRGIKSTQEASDQKYRELELSLKIVSAGSSLAQLRQNQVLYMKNEIIKHNSAVPIEMAHNIALWITNYSEDYNIDPWFVFSIAQTESNFSPSAVSNRNAIGIMQIIPRTGRDLCEELRYQYNIELLQNPETNIELACKLLRNLNNSYTTFEEVLAEYNMGGRGPEIYKDNARKLVEETKGYILETLKWYQQYKSTYVSIKS